MWLFISVEYLHRMEFQMTLKHHNLTIHTLMGYTLRTKRNGKTKQKNPSTYFSFFLDTQVIGVIL